jgi:hypothetical protein
MATKKDRKDSTGGATASAASSSVEELLLAALERHPANGSEGETTTLLCKLCDKF